MSGISVKWKKVFSIREAFSEYPQISVGEIFNGEKVKDIELETLNFSDEYDEIPLKQRCYVIYGEVKHIGSGRQVLGHFLATSVNVLYYT